jgi:hypothetical protein
MCAPYGRYVDKDGHSSAEPAVERELPARRHYAWRDIPVDELKRKTELKVSDQLKVLPARSQPTRSYGLLGIEGLSRDDINHVLDLADGYVELNREAGKKVNTSLTLRVPEGWRPSPLLRSRR